MLKTLGAQLKQYKWVSILTPVFMVLEALMETFIPKMMGAIIDNGVTPGNIPYIYKMGIWMLIAAVFALFTGIMGGILGAKSSTGFAKNLRKSMFDNIQTFSFSNIDKFSTAGLVTRMTTDVTNLQNAFQMLLRMGVRAPISLILAMIMAFSINWRLSLIYLIAVILLGVLLIIVIRHATKYFSQVFSRYDDLNGSVQENVSAIRVVKAYVREDYETNKFQKASANIYNMIIKAENTVALTSPFMQATVYACILLISWFGAKMIVHSSLSTGELTTLLSYCMTILMNLMMLSMFFVMITMSIPSAKRICEVIEEETALHNPQNPIMDVPNGEITFDHVFFQYKKDAESPVLSDINLHIKSGETIGILGGTGSSKSSLVSLISRLYDVTEGSVSVGGNDVRAYDMEVLRNQVAVVLQNNVLFSGTILENLRWGNPDATLEECMHAAKLACAHEFISSFPDGYDTYIEQGGTNVSGGQKQRLCIARALLKNPKVLILDDSTSAVDTATDAKIRHAFAHEIPDTTKLIIAQRISSIQDADHILVLENGCVNGYGTHEELLVSNEIYRDIYEAQTNGGGDFDEKGGVVNA